MLLPPAPQVPVSSEDMVPMAATSHHSEPHTFSKWSGEFSEGTCGHVLCPALLSSHPFKVAPVLQVGRCSSGRLDLCWELQSHYKAWLVSLGSQARVLLWGCPDSSWTLSLVYSLLSQLSAPPGGVGAAQRELMGLFGSLPSAGTLVPSAFHRGDMGHLEGSGRLAPLLCLGD